MTLTVVGWLLDAQTKSERAIAGAGWAPSMGGATAEPLVLRVDSQVEIERLRELANSEGSRAVKYLRRARRTEAVLRTLVDLCDRIDLDRPTFADCAALRSARAVLDRSEHDACTWPSCGCVREPASACALGFTGQALDG